jgi:hypothetical protein
MGQNGHASRCSTKEVLVDPADRLRERERRLVTKYGGDHPPKSFDGEDLQSEDPADAEHWVGVYSELVQFMHSLIEAASQASPDQAPPGNGLRGLRLQAQVLELHLAYWTDRLNGLSGIPDSHQGRRD